jgi:RNA polymerase sigma factor (sigma-70 family)
MPVLVINVIFPQAKQQAHPIIPINLVKGVSIMQENLPLDFLLHEFREGKLGKKELESSIFEHILKTSRQFRLYNWPRDEYVDFLCALYPRISRAIDKYQDEGSSFDAYIVTIVRWAAREYIQTEVNHRITEQTYWDACTQEMAVCETEPSYDITGPCKPVSNPRQVLLLLLKSYYFLSEDFIDRVAPAIGMKKETLQCLVGQLRNLRIHRDEAIKDIQERIYSQYYRCIAFEKRMNAAPLGSARHEKLKTRLEKARKRLETMRKRFKRLRTEPTNQQVAQVLGIPKGTVDSNFFAIKAKAGGKGGNKKISSGDHFDDDNSAAQIVLK